METISIVWHTGKYQEGDCISGGRGKCEDGELGICMKLAIEIYDGCLDHNFCCEDIGDRKSVV